MRGFGWRRLQWIAAFATLASFAIPMVVQLKLEPFLLTLAGPVVVAMLVNLRWPRVGSLLLGAALLADLLPGIPFLADALSHPEARLDFIPLSIFTVGTIVGSVAAWPAFRSGRSPTPSGAARGIAIAGGAVVVLATVISLIVSAGVRSSVARPGDIAMSTKDAKYAPVRIEARAGTVSIHVQNLDSVRHTLTIKSLGVDLELPPNSAQRIDFEAEPGTYKFSCRPHGSAMKGVLIVA